ncbi:MAG: DUF3810 domain-containing protein [Pyrinomonadaceae bacterium]
MRKLFLTSSRFILSHGRDFVLPLTVLLSGIVFQHLASFVPWLVEDYYSRSIYMYVLGSLSPMSRGTRFSVGEILACLILLTACAGVLVFGVGLVRRRGGRRSWVLVWLRYGVWGAAGLLWFFLLTFGLNYQRPLLFELIGYEQKKAEPVELEALGHKIVESVNHYYLEAHEGERPAPDSVEVIKLLNESLDAAPELSFLPKGAFPPPKPIIASEVLTRLGISGIYFPFTAEPNYNRDIPDFQIPFSIAHEMAHQRGVARESEANFVAYVACINSRDPFVRYSGYRNGLGVLSELYKVDPEKARELARQLGPGYREDSRRAARFWAKAAGAAGALSHRVNDLYLRANRVKAGAADYSNSTTLIIAYHLRQKTSGGVSPLVDETSNVPHSRLRYSTKPSTSDSGGSNRSIYIVIKIINWERSRKLCRVCGRQCWSNTRRFSMGDECTCEKCQAGCVTETGVFVWQVVRAETQAEGRGHTQRKLYLIVTERGISLRQQSHEM